MKKIKVLIADDSFELREAMKVLLSSNKEIEVIGEAKNGVEAVEKTLNLHPDILLLDIRMPTKDGLTALKEIKKKHSQVKVVILSILDERECVREAFNLGASGYIVKDVDGAKIASILKKIEAGQVYVHPLAINFLVSQLQHTDQAKLNDEEKKVLNLLAEGYTNEQISTGLGLKLDEVRKVILEVLDKLKPTEKAQEIAIKLRAHLTS